MLVFSYHPRTLQTIVWKSWELESLRLFKPWFQSLLPSNPVLSRGYNFWPPHLPFGDAYPTLRSVLRHSAFEKSRFLWLSFAKAVRGCSDSENGSYYLHILKPTAFVPCCFFEVYMKETNVVNYEGAQFKASPAAIRAVTMGLTVSQTVNGKSTLGSRGYLRSFAANGPPGARAQQVRWSGDFWASGSQ